MLDKGTPRILVVGGQGRRPDTMQSSIGIMPYMMQPGEYKVVADAISKYLRHPGHVCESAGVHGRDCEPCRHVECRDRLCARRWQADVHAGAERRRGHRGAEGRDFQRRHSRARSRADHVILRSNMPANGYAGSTLTVFVSGNSMSGESSWRVWGGDIQGH